jgi:Zn-dependent alcohol dehydrogenase
LVFSVWVVSYPKTPWILGEEGAETVEEVGEGLREFKKGDCVAFKATQVVLESTLT